MDWDVQKEIDDDFLDKIYDIRFMIALNSASLLLVYLINTLGYYWGDLPKDWTDHQREEFYQKYPDEISARELKKMYPEIYKLGYIDKLKNGETLITEIKLKVLGNKLKLENENGYTLNEIAYLGHELFKINFWHDDYYRREACIRMSLDIEKDGSLKVDIGCDT